MSLKSSDAPAKRESPKGGQTQVGGVSSGRAAATEPDGPFTAEQVTILQHLVGPAIARQILPELTQSITHYLKKAHLQSAERRQNNVARSSAKADENIAAELERLAGGLAYALDQCEPFIREAFLCGDYPHLTLADVALGRPRSDEERWQALRKFIRSTRSDVIFIERAAQAWAQRARSRGRGKRGRPPQGCAELVASVGIALARSGHKLTKGADGVWARVIQLVYEVAGLKVPKDVVPVLSEAFSLLQVVAPGLVRRRSPHKMSKQQK